MRLQLLALPLAFLLLCPAASHWLVTVWQQYSIREAVEEQLRQGMAPSDLTQLAFADSEVEQLLDWEHEREFEFQGQMYDVVKVESRNDSTFYTCYQDHAETALHKKIDRWLADWLGQDPQHKHQSERLSCFLRSLCCVSVDKSCASAAYTPSQAFFDYQDRIGLLSNPPPLPPPRRGLFI